MKQERVLSLGREVLAFLANEERPVRKPPCTPSQYLNVRKRPRWDSLVPNC